MVVVKKKIPDLEIQKYIPWFSRFFQIVITLLRLWLYGPLSLLGLYNLRRTHHRWIRSFPPHSPRFRQRCRWSSSWPGQRSAAARRRCGPPCRRQQWPYVSPVAMTRHRSAPPGRIPSRTHSPRRTTSPSPSKGSGSDRRPFATVFNFHRFFSLARMFLFHSGGAPSRRRNSRTREITRLISDFCFTLWDYCYVRMAMTTKGIIVAKRSWLERYSFVSAWFRIFSYNNVHISEKKGKTNVGSKRFLAERMSFEMPRFMKLKT